jgi:hypothetical protein
MLADFWEEQMGKPFEYELRLMDLLARQEEPNATLDLGKNERQAARQIVNSEFVSDYPIVPKAARSDTASSPPKRKARRGTTNIISQSEKEEDE